METSNRIQKLEERLKAEDSILNPPAAPSKVSVICLKNSNLISSIDFMKILHDTNLFFESHRLLMELFLSSVSLL